MEGEKVRFPNSERQCTPISGSAGMCCHVPGAMASVSNLAYSTGGIKPGGIAERGIDSIRKQK